MPRIPIIEQTTSVSTTTPSPQAQGQQVVSPFGNSLQVAAQGLNEIAGAEVRNQNTLWHKENADAIANTGKPLSDADVYWKQYLVDTGKQTVDGGMLKQDDGTMVPFRAKAEKDFDTWSTGFLGGISNEKARVYAQNHINALRTQTLDSALRYEAQAGIENRSQKVDEAVQTWASAAAKDDSSVAQLVVSAKTMIANSGFDEKTRYDKAVAAQKMIVEAAVTGRMERDPAATRAALVARYGVDPIAPPKPGSVPGVNPGDGSVFGQAVSFTLKAEGGLNPADTNGTPSNFGINQASHPGIDVTKLTQAQAAAIYKKDYWDFIGGDALAAKNPALAIVAFDTTVLNKSKGREFLEKSGGDPAKYMALREEFLASLIAKDPAKYGPYKKAWETRNAELRATISVGGGRGLVNPPAAIGADATMDLPAPAPAPINPQLAALVDQLPADRLPAFISHANTLVNQQQALVRSQLTVAEGDHVTAFMNGQAVPKPLTETDYTNAYGPIDGPQRFANYQQIQQLGSDITSMKAMPPEQMQALTERYRPDPAKPGYELATKRYETILKAADQVNTARQADPMAYAMQSGIGGAQPLNFQDQKAFVAELAKRQGVASTMQQTYGAPFSLLTKAEATTLNKGFETMTTQQRLGYLNSIKSSLSDPAAYRAVMQQIAPDSPVTAMAGMILSKQQPVIVRNTFSADTVYQQQDVAGVLLEGEALLNPTKTAKGEDGKGKVFPMPKEQDMRDQFSSAVGKAFAADPRGADFAYQAVKAYYAGKAAREGDITGTMDSGRLKDAIAAVTGGVSDVNGKGEVLRPWGMSEARFKDKAKAAFDKAIAANGYKGSAIDVYGAYGLQSAGDSKYMLRSGTGYLTSRTGAPIILDLTEKPSLVDQIPTGRQTDGGRGWTGQVVPEKNAKPNTQQPQTK